MWENAYLSIKNPKASRALKRALDPSRKLLASLARLCFATSATFGLSTWGPPFTKSWIRTWITLALSMKNFFCSLQTRTLCGFQWNSTKELHSLSRRHVLTPRGYIDQLYSLSQWIKHEQRDGLYFMQYVLLISDCNATPYWLSCCS